MKKPNFLKLSKLCMRVFLISFIAAVMFGKGTLGYGYCFIVCVVFLPLSVLLRGAHNGTLPEYNETEEERQARYERSAENERKRRDNRRPVSARLISVEYYQNPLRAFCRAAIGDWVGGYWASRAWAASTPSKARRVTFNVRYANGRIGEETVYIGSKRFYHLSALCD